MDIVRKLILLITGILIAVRGFYPVRYFYGSGRYYSLSWEIKTHSAAIAAPIVDIATTAFQCIGIAVIGGVLF